MYELAIWKVVLADLLFFVSGLGLGAALWKRNKKSKNEG